MGRNKQKELKSLLKNEKYLIALASVLTAMSVLINSITDNIIKIFNTFFK